MKKMTGCKRCGMAGVGFDTRTGYHLACAVLAQEAFVVYDLDPEKCSHCAHTKFRRTSDSVVPFCAECGCNQLLRDRAETSKADAADRR